jgi:hypothetical protein
MCLPSTGAAPEGTGDHHLHDGCRAARWLGLHERGASGVVKRTARKKAYVQGLSWAGSYANEFTLTATVYTSIDEPLRPSA